AQQGPQPRQDLLGVEWLGDVIVSARVEAGHFVAPAVARGQDEHRHFAPSLAPALEHGDAIHLGQPQIEDNGIVRLGIAEEMSFLAVPSNVHDIASVGQRLFQKALQVLIIFDYENAHFLPAITKTPEPTLRSSFRWTAVVTTVGGPAGRARRPPV